MALKEETSINCMLLIVTVWARLRLLAAESYDYSYWGNCAANKYGNGSAFQHNLDQVFESLLENVTTSGFNTSVAGINSNSAVYGLVQCRGDLDSSDCEQCALANKALLVEECQNSISGFIWLDDCFLRYDNHNFYNDWNKSNELMHVVSNNQNVYNKSSNELMDFVCNNNKSYMPVQFGNTTAEVLSNTIDKAVQSAELFATSKVDTVDSDSREIYALAQCWRDLSPTNCRSCLTNGRSIIAGAGRLSNSDPGCATGANGARFRSRNCALRYEIYGFFNTAVTSPPPPPPPPSPSPSPSPGESTPRSGEEGEISSLPTVNPELIFKYHVLREATSDFKAENKLGEGGFGSVFKGVLPDGREVAVKRLRIGSRQGDAEFFNEANLISCIQHRNLVKLLGCCVESSERLLVYEYLQNSSLDKIIFDTANAHLLKWRERCEIIVGTARGLAYLHEQSEIRIIHRDIKASNILLDNKYRPKITDFGLAKLFAEDQSHVSTRVAGTLGYVAPEYALSGQLTEKADVFSFGVLLLEIVSGRKNQSFAPGTEFLVEETWRLYKEERALEIMDSTLEGSYSWGEASRVIIIGLLCTQAASVMRPPMSQVVSMLTSKRDLPSPTKPAIVDLDGAGTADQVEHGRFLDPGQTPSSAATPSTTPEIHSAAADPSSGILEPR